MSKQGIKVNLRYILDKKDRGDEHKGPVSFSPLSFTCMAILSLSHPSCLAHSLP